MTDASDDKAPLASYEAFKAVFRSEIAPDLSALERERTSASDRAARAFLMCLPIYLFLGALWWLDAVPWWAGLGGILLAMWVGSAWRATIWDAFLAAWKPRVINRIVKAVHPDLTYKPTGGIAATEFIGTRIFNERVDRYGCEDEVSGWIGKTQLRCSEVLAEHKTETRDSNGHRRTQWHTIFRGWFVLVDFHKEFTGEFVVLPDTAESTFGGFGRWLQSMNASRDSVIRMDDPEFEKAFVVYGTDQVEARYILTPALMQRILAVRKRSGSGLHIGFTQSIMCLAIPRSRDAFEAEKGRSLLDPETHRQNVEDLIFITGLVEDLNLNTRIWSKR